MNKGPHTAGGARQDRGTVSTAENCQIRAFLGYGRRLGYPLLDGALSLPEAWPQNREHCRKAGILDEQSCATTPLLARAFAANVPATSGTRDRMNGDNCRLDLWWEAYPRPMSWRSRVKKLSGWAGGHSPSTRSRPAGEHRPLSVPEMRRLLWRLVLAVPQTATSWRGHSGAAGTRPSRGMITISNVWHRLSI
jgi:hypothetical protein